MYTHNFCVSSSQFGIMEHSSHVCVCAQVPKEQWDVMESMIRKTKGS